MSVRPLLLVSDAITSPTGFGRVTRELAIHIHENLSEVFRLGTAGYGGNTSRKFPWTQYVLSTMQTYTLPELPSIWNDFAGDEKGVIFFLFNASWMYWVHDPDKLPDSDLKGFLKAKPFESWLYFPVDSEGPGGKLSEQEAKIFAAFDRVLTYTEWGAGVVDRTMENCSTWNTPCQHLPHGTDVSIFFPRDRHEARQCFIQRVVKKEKGYLADGIMLLGVCATNTDRKDWALAFEVCAELISRGVNVGLWAHTDRFQKAWDLPMLADRFGMKLRTIFTNNHLTDEDMSWGYAACDCTLGIGSGEGWGLGNSESLACGVPAVHGNYAGGTEFIPSGLLVEPSGFKYDGFFACKRPTFKAAEWADRVIEATIHPDDKRESLLDRKFYWSNCWSSWEKWFREGVHE